MNDKILNSLTNTIHIEANALFDLKNHISQDLIDAVYFLHSLKGRIVITGIGKSAIIAQKIVATLNSTGSQSIFLHAADAVHGDLGIIHEDDAVICISKSGDTSELKVLISLIKNRGNKIISIVCNKNSFLANQADYCIYLPMDKEADPNNLAPTTSTILQLAIGDAIAIALLELRGFTPQHFALLHPGGNLGKMLYTKVKDISYKNEKPKVLFSEQINQIIITITSSRLGATAVIDNENKLIGIITDGDLRRMLQKIGYNQSTTAEEIMSPNPKTIEATALAIDAMNAMQSQSISQLIVIENEKYEGIIHIHDLIREGII
jgi:arabinose-5-phosphate isomerase